jgi:hypothetical protein
MENPANSQHDTEGKTDRIWNERDCHRADERHSNAFLKVGFVVKKAEYG